MHSLLRRSLGHVLPALALLLTAPSLRAQTPGAIDCSPGGHAADCRIPLRPGQTSLQIRFRPTILPAAGKTEHYHVLGEGVVATEASATATEPGIIEWRGSITPTRPVPIIVERKNPPHLTTTIQILPPEGPVPLTLQNNLGAYVAHRDSWIPLLLRVGIGRENGAFLTEEECTAVRYRVTPLPNGEAEADSGVGAYDPDDNKYRCYAEFRWKLANVTGDQQLRITAGDGTRFTREESQLGAYAREPARIVVGAGLFSRHRADETRFCESYEQEVEECAENRGTTEDSIKRTRDVTMENRWEPYFAIEVPITPSVQPGNAGLRFLSRRVRLVGGSTFDRPLDNFFVGLGVVPLVLPRWEDAKVQLHGAWRWNGGFMAGVTFDGSGVLSGVLKTLGAPL